MVNKLQSLGILALGGGGNEVQSKELDFHFFNLIKPKKILYIPLALDLDSLGYEYCYDWIIQTITLHFDDFIEIEMCLDLNQATLEGFDCVYIGGGNTFRLLHLIYQSGFNLKLINFYNNGGHIYGGSAGAIILGKSIETVIFEKSKTKLNNYKEGLNLLGEHSVICHFKNNPTQNSIIQKFIKCLSRPVIALPETCGLILDQNLATIRGDTLTVFYPNGYVKQYEKGQSFNLS